MKEVIKKVLVAIDWIFLKIQGFAISAFRKDNLNATMLSFCKAAETKSTYVSYQIKPKDTTEIPILSGLEQSHSFAIVLQGPICIKDEMTYNTVRFYKQTYPYANIIISTWVDEAEENVKRLAELGTIIVRNEKPSNNGFWNVNYQIVSSLAGIKKAQELGCEFAVKTRTDQRVCKPFIFDTMLSSTQLFPSVSEKQRSRIATLDGFGCGMFFPYHTCDFLYLGYTEDLIQLFSIPLDLRVDDMNIRRNLNYLTRHQLSEQMLPPEIYIMKHYCMDVLGFCCKDTVESYWHVVKNYLICYGMKDVDLMWDKYNCLYDLNRYTFSYYGRSDSHDRLSTMCFDFFNWLNLYMGNIKYDKHYEKYADVTLFATNDKKTY